MKENRYYFTLSTCFLFWLVGIIGIISVETFIWITNYEYVLFLVFSLMIVISLFSYLYFMAKYEKRN